MIISKKSDLNPFQVHSPNYTLLAATHLEEDKQVVNWARLNQLTVPRFTAGKSVFVRDLQYGNYRSYRVRLYLLNAKLKD